MKVLLIGHGGMGKGIEYQAKARDHEIVYIIEDTEALKKVDGTKIDVAIDVTHPDAVINNIKILAEKGINTVVGTTGWYDHLAEVEKIAKEANIGFLWSSNFSIGVNLFFRMVEDAAKLINAADEYDIWGTEIHHHNKADSPSGTAKTIEDILLKNIDRKTKVTEDKLDRKIEPNEIHFSSTRGGPINFGHTIGFDSAADTIKLEHAARNRDGYTLGAVKCAEWLKGKKGFFSMDDYMQSVF